MNPSAQKLGTKCFGLVLLVTFSVPMAFAFFTNHIWEDYYITFRASKNLAEGHGLVFQIGERLHTFTSPLGVLLPAILSWLTKSDLVTLWLFRLFSCGALAGTAALLWKTLQDHHTHSSARWLCLGLLLFNPTTIDFTINGMETAFLLFFAMLAFRELSQPQGPTPYVLGGAWAGMMWSRPDAFIPGAATFIAITIFYNRSRTKIFWISAGKAAGWAASLYGPWLLWAWWYYGSPVPHTIIAKTGMHLPVTMPQFLIQAPLDFMAGGSVMSWLFMPSYHFFGGWSSELLNVSKILAVLAGFIWMLPWLPALARSASFVVFAGSFYLQAIPLFPWYLPVWHMLAAVALGCGAAVWLSSIPPQHWSRPLVRSVLAIVLIVQGSTLCLTAWQVRQQQTIIEDNGRRDIGLWLADNAQPGDTVFLECLGYIGYFSQMKMLDYPGLSSREVIDARYKTGQNFAKIVGQLNPAWLVLRPTEVSHHFTESGALDHYELKRIWDARSALDQIGFLPGRALLEFDAVFFVYKRRSANSPQMVN